MSRTVFDNGDPNNPSASADSEPILIPGKTSTRFWAEVADVFMTLILGIVLYSVAFLPAFGYNGYNQKMQDLSGKMVDEEVSSYLISMDSSGLTYSEEDLQRFWINHYQDGNTLNEQGVSSDFIFDYYTLYRKAGVWTVSRYNQEVLGLPAKVGDVNASPYFAFDLSATDPSNALGVFSASTHATLAPYFSSSQTTESVVLYQNLKSFFTKIYETARDEFVKSEPFYSLLISYAEVFHSRVGAFIGAAFMAYVVSSSLFFLVVPLIKLRGNTLGKKILKLEVANPNGSRPKIWQMFSRAAVEVIEFSFLVPFMPVLSLGFDGFSLPLFTLGSWQVSLTAVFVAGFVVSLASTLLMFFGKKHASLHTLASLSAVYTSDYAIIDAERSKREKAKEAENGNAGE